MARRPKKAAKARRGKVGEVSKARDYHERTFGRLSKDGSAKIELETLESFKEFLKRELGQESWGKVKFVARNAPFKRGSPISST
jgi:hypothetical protein